MSTSYQDIDVRLVGVENALRFLMESMSVRQGDRILSMFEFYREQLAKGILEAAGVTDGTDDSADSE